MMKKRLLILLFLGVGLTINAQYDWDAIPIPADAGAGKSWVLQSNVSDDFNYTFAASNSKTNFGNNKWYNFYHNSWNGPGTTYWQYNHIAVNGSDLVIKTSRNTSTSKMGVQGVNAGCITSTNRVVFPVYVESSISVANIALASDFWLLSADDTQEIDILENYGSVNYFKQFTHISHHSFIRNPFHDYQPKDVNSWYPDSRVSASYGWGDWCWNNGARRYMRMGVNWIAADHFEYYIDGKLVRVMYKNAMATNMKGTWEYTYYNSKNADYNGTVIKDSWGNNISGLPTTNANGYSAVTKHATGTTYSFATLQAASTASNVISVIDPGSYQGGANFTKELDIIINVESQSWLVSSGSTPTDADLSNPDKNEMKVDWVRVYKPLTDGVQTTSESLSFDDFNKYKNSSFEVGSAESMTVNVNYDAGTGNVINSQGVKVWLREITSGWTSVVKDYVAYDVTTAGTQSGVATVTIPLENVPATKDLASGNFYFLFVSFTNATGGNYSIPIGVSPLNLVDDIENLSVSTIAGEQLKMYPNPVSKVLYFKGAEEFDSLNVFSAIGTKLLTLNDVSTGELNVSTLLKGLYFVEFLKGSQRIMKTLMVE
jgi:hypothetical protein